MRNISVKKIGPVVQENIALNMFKDISICRFFGHLISGAERIEQYWLRTL